MIDAQAVWAHLQELANYSTEEQRAAGFQDYLHQLFLKHERDAAGNYFLTLPGKSERTVVLGSYLASDTGDLQTEARLDLVTGLETLRALAHRFDGAPPCTLVLVVWAKPAGAPFSSADSAISALLSLSVTAYLGMHVDFVEQLKGAAAELGVVEAVSTGDTTAFNPRLVALCDEAVRELTGTSASLPEATDEVAAAMVRNNIPTALMYVEAPRSSANEEISTAKRLHMLQAAEAFGRWVESAMHLVAGDDIDLWAREERVPHSHVDAS